MTLYECNFDGLIGLSHHYGGIADGNLASKSHKHQVAKPKAAALQGLDKMQLISELGVPQFFLPPVFRPSQAIFDAFGVDADNQSSYEHFCQQHPELISPLWSASSMWTANAATFCPMQDSMDGKAHLTVANLFTNLHRQLEASARYQQFKALFNHVSDLVIHPPLLQSQQFADEGAANHSRLCKSHGDKGVHLFAYGHNGEQADFAFNPRQHLCASQAIASQQGIACTVFAQNSIAAMNAGAFHNDVVCVVNESTLLMHETAFADEDKLVQQLQAKCEFDLTILSISNDELSIDNAVTSYLFNSQLLTVKGEQWLIAPIEVKNNQQANAVVTRLLNEGHIQQVRFVDLTQSMQNGGGPACLRLRLVLSEQQMSEVNSKLQINSDSLAFLRQWVNEYYPEKLTESDLTDFDLIAQSRKAHAALEQYLGCKLESES